MQPDDTPMQAIRSQKLICMKQLKVIGNQIIEDMCAKTGSNRAQNTAKCLGVRLGFPVVYCIYGGLGGF